MSELSSTFACGDVFGDFLFGGEGAIEVRGGLIAFRLLILEFLDSILLLFFVRVCDLGMVCES